MLYCVFPCLCGFGAIISRNHYVKIDILINVYIKIYNYGFAHKPLPISIIHPIWFSENTSGWIACVGMLGLKAWNGSLSGILPLPFGRPLVPFFATYGFSRLKIFSGSSEPVFLLDNALAVGIEEK